MNPSSKADKTTPIGQRSHRGTSLYRPGLSLAIVGIGLCVTVLRLDAQPPLPRPAARAAAGAEFSGPSPPALLKAQIAIAIPKNMRLGASTLVRVTIWDKRAEAQARATLPAGPLVPTDVLVGRSLRVELAELQRGDFAVHAMTQAIQLLLAGRVLRWEWTVVPLRPGEHGLSVVATNLADGSGKPLVRTVHSMSVQVEVTNRQGSGQQIAQPKQAIPPKEALQQALEQDPSYPDYLEERAEPDATGVNARKWKYAAFFNRMKSLVRGEWHPDELLSRHDPSGGIYGAIDRTTVLQAQLQPDGRIADLKVARSSGVEFLDEEAMSAFRRAQPFENPPLALIDKDGFIRFKFAFIVQRSGHTSFKVSAAPRFQLPKGFHSVRNKFMPVEPLYFSLHCGLRWLPGLLVANGDGRRA